MTKFTLSALLVLPVLVSAGTPTAAIKAASSKNPKAPLQALAPPPEVLGWTLGAGLQWRQIGEVSFNGSHQAGLSDLPRVRTPRAGGSGGGYSDGYVLPDSTNGSQTWNWGFDSASQVSGNLLNFHGSSTEVVSVLTQKSFDADWSDDLAGVGAFIDLESPELIRRGNFGLSVKAGYSFTQDEVSQRTLAWQAHRYLMERHVSYTDSYDISAIAPVTPQQGTFNGPGPVISRTPASRSGGGGGSNGDIIDDTVYSSHLEQSLEVRLHTLSIGPRASYHRNKLRLIGGLGFGLNIADWEASSKEELSTDKGKVIRRWQDGASGTEVLAGAYAELSAEYQINARWSVFTTARYDVVQDFTGEVAKSTFDLDLGGFTAMLGVGWRF